MALDERTLDALLAEDRTFPPPPGLAATANARDPELYRRAAQDPEGFWADHAAELDWFRPWDNVFQWDPPFAQWFVGGKLNASYNCIDRHLKTWRRNKAALIWEGEPGDHRVLTYQDLYREVCRFAHALKKLGVRKGDRVTLYLPMIPELAIAMLACARIGAVHSVVFGGFSVEALRDRILDARSEVVVTADGGYRRGGIVPLKRNVDEALKECPDVRSVVVVRRVGQEALDIMADGRDHWWDELVHGAPQTFDPEPMDAEDLLFILYTSGTTGKPKGIVHTTGGYLTGTYTTAKYIFDLKEDDVYWCTADIGWITGHSYVVYGPLANGATVVMYEGAPDYPGRDRFWEIIEKYRVTIFYTAPTAIRTFMRWGIEWPERHDLSSLRILGTVGEPINPEAWIWFYHFIGRERCPIMDTWWQTETGSIMITPLPGLVTTKPGSATIPFPGIEADVVDNEGNPVPPGKGGYLVIKRPWPSMLRGIYGDPERFKAQYWSRFPGLYFTGDGARKDEDGCFWVLGRIDDVIKVAGHRIGTMEVESALVDHPLVAEAAVIGRHHEIKGQAITAFVTLKEGAQRSELLAQQLRDHVGAKIGPIAKPDDIIFTAELPKTRSGKIMRRLLRDIAESRQLGDTSTLADSSVIENLQKAYSSEEEAG
ncbi:MAG: acetate--CoA ligase [Betaproteobacteria bacterium]